MANPCADGEKDCILGAVCYPSGSEGFIGEESTDKTSQRTVADRLAELDVYAAKHPGEQVSARLLKLVPELNDLLTYGIAIAARSVPTKAPALWKEDRLPHEKPADFVTRVYGQWAGRITLADVRKTDAPLWAALENFKSYHDRLPTGFHLPTLHQHYAGWAESLRQPVSADDPTTKLRVLRRMMSAAQERQGRS